MRISHFKKLTLSALTISLLSFAAQANDLQLRYDHPAVYWEEALPIGNGRIAGMVYGQPADEEIQLNEETVSAGAPYENHNPEAKDALDEIRRLIFTGSYAEAQNLAGEKILSKNGFGKPYQTVGSLRLHFDGHENYQDFQRTLDLNQAVATTTYTVDGVTYKREAFASFADQLIIVRLTASRPGSLNFSARLTCPQQVQREVPDSRHLSMEGMTRGNGKGDSDGQEPRLRFRADLQLKTKAGSAVHTDSSLVVKGATEAIIYVAMATNFVNYKDISADPVPRNQASPMPKHWPSTQRLIAGCSAGSVWTWDAPPRPTSPPMYGSKSLPPVSIRNWSSCISNLDAICSSAVRCPAASRPTCRASGMPASTRPGRAAIRSTSIPK